MNLVTGATGHIGNVLVRQLLAAGQRVRALIWRGEDTRPLEGLRLETVTGDVLDPQCLKLACDGVDTIYHLAGIISILPGKNALVQRVNVDGTRRVLETAAESRVRRVVYTSSIHAIARAPHGVTIDERLPFDPSNPYGVYDRAKAQASLDVLEAARKGLDAVIVCPTGVIGPYDYRRSEMGQVILDCARQKPQLYVDGRYDFVDVRDVAKGLVLAAERGTPGESYILSGEAISVRWLLDAVRQVTGKSFFRLRMPIGLARLAAIFTPLHYRLWRLRPRFTPYSLEVLASNSDISSAKAQRELSYSARPLRKSVADAVHWFLENRNLWAHKPGRA